MGYRVYDWYWCVGGDQSNVWSSKRAMPVPVDDDEYISWLAVAGSPTYIDTMQALEAVFAEQYPSGALTTYTSYKRWQKEQGGITLASGMPIKTDDRAQAKINGVMIAGTGKSNFTTKWHASDGTFWSLDENAIAAMSTELQAHINQCFSISSQVMDGIENGSITTLDQIDAAFDGTQGGKRQSLTQKEK